MGSNVFPLPVGGNRPFEKRLDDRIEHLRTLHHDEVTHLRIHAVVHFVTLSSLNHLGDALRDALDPKMVK